jgi:hypothetical protein
MSIRRAIRAEWLHANGTDEGEEGLCDDTPV